MGVAEGCHDAAEPGVVPEIGVMEGCERALLMQGAEIVIDTGIIDRIGVWIVPVAIPGGE